MPDLDVGSTVYWVVDSRTGQTYGKPRPSEQAALKRANGLNSVVGSALYIVRAAQIVAVVTDDAMHDALGEAKKATRAVSKAMQQIGEREATAAESLTISDLHKEAREAWFGIWSENKDEFAAFLVDMHEQQEEAWLEDAKES